MRMKIIAATSLIIALATLAACSPAATEAQDLVSRWLNGDASVQCVGASSTWTSYELGVATRLETTDGVERWSVEIEGARSGTPARGGILVDIGSDSSCVRWYEESGN